MLSSCRYIAVAWAAIGLLTLAAGLAAGRNDLTRVGTLALVTFGTVGLALSADDLVAMVRRLLPHGGGTPSGGGARALWERPIPYVLLPATAFVVLVGRMLMRPSLGTAEARYAALGLTVGAVVLAVAGLWLVFADAGGRRWKARP